MTEDQIKAECERLFQAGGPRLYTFDPLRSSFRAEHGRASWVAETAGSEYQAWQRRKMPKTGKYEWKQVGSRKAAQHATLPPSNMDRWNKCPAAKPNPWHPLSNPVDLKVMGKFSEEINELGAAIARCIIQGVDEREPVTGKLNREWVEDEMADFQANMELVQERFGFKIDPERVKRKKAYQTIWHNQA